MNETNPEKRKRLNAEQKRERLAASLQQFAQQYARKSRASGDANDRTYERETEKLAKRMRPDELDRLLRDGE